MSLMIRLLTYSFRSGFNVKYPDMVHTLCEVRGRVDSSLEPGQGHLGSVLSFRAFCLSFRNQLSLSDVCGFPERAILVVFTHMLLSHCQYLF